MDPQRLVGVGFVDTQHVHIEDSDERLADTDSRSFVESRQRGSTMGGPIEYQPGRDFPKVMATT